MREMGRLLGFSTPYGFIGFGLFLGFCLVAAAAPHVAPFDPLVINYDEAGRIQRLLPPSDQFWLGTTNVGRDVFSQVIVGSRVSIAVGLLSALIIVFIDANIRLMAGYRGGRIEAVLMRLTDSAFGIPFFPFAVRLVALLKPSIWNMIITISGLLWWSAARVVRSQVLSVRERP